MPPRIPTVACLHSLDDLCYCSDDLCYCSVSVSNPKPKTTMCENKGCCHHKVRDPNCRGQGADYKTVYRCCRCSKPPANGSYYQP